MKSTEIVVAEGFRRSRDSAEDENLPSPSGVSVAESGTKPCTAVVFFSIQCSVCVRVGRMTILGAST